MNKNIMKMKYPSSWWGAKWREALPSGNGEIGAAVYGGVNIETIIKFKYKENLEYLN